MQQAYQPMKLVTHRGKKKKKKSRLVVPDFFCNGLGKAAGSCLSAVSTLDISLMIPVLEVAGRGPRMETWRSPKSWRQWKLFLLPRMRNWSYLLAPVHKGGLVAGNRWPGNRLSSPRGAGRSLRVYAQQGTLCCCHYLLSTDISKVPFMPPFPWKGDNKREHDLLVRIIAINDNTHRTK